MKLIKRTTLLYQEGSSDKVYEVDLCEVGENRYVVNFRYGRRGANLKEGAKTDQAVPLAEAQKVFNDLVNSKTKKGYRDVSTSTTDNLPTPPPVVTTNVVDREDARKQAILKRLSNRTSDKWSLERVIWRAGELRISEATPLLIPLIGTKDALRDYCIAWALGWCGGQGAIPQLINLYQKATTPEFVSRISFEAILKLSDAQTRSQLQSEMIEFLPTQLQAIARNGSSADFSSALRTYLENSDAQNFTVLDTIYRIDNQYVRPALQEILRTAPLKPNYFKPIRHIFKMAEYRMDAEVFAIILKRFENEPAMYRSNGYYIPLPNGGYIQKYEYKYNPATRRRESSENPAFTQEINSPNARIAYSHQTREYFKRRLWRTLRELGQLGDDSYVNMAANILLQYSDTDAKSIRNTTFYRWEKQGSSWNRVAYHRSWDAYASYIIFNHILYENSSRYLLKPNSKAWRCSDNYKPGDPEPKNREEAFPELWSKKPDALLRLLLESNCHPVHSFAAKALRECQAFCTNLDINIVIKLINKAYPTTAQLGFELARERYNPNQPNLELVLALANCLYTPGREQAYHWIEQQRDRFLESDNFIAALITSPQPDTRTFVRRLLSTSIVSDATTRVLINKLITQLLELQPNQTNIAKEIGETLLLSFTPQLRDLAMDVILNLLKHPMLEVQEIAARILLNHLTPAVELPVDLIESLLASPSNSIRAIGVSIFGQLPDSKLIQDRELIVSMAINHVADIRHAIRSVIRRLANLDSNFKNQVISDFIEILLTPERHEGVHADLVNLLKEDISDSLSNISRKTAMGLLDSSSSVVQELGGLALNHNCDRWITEFDTSEIVKLANHEILSVREAAQTMFRRIVDRLHSDSQELLKAVRILESKWQDSRQFAREVFHNQFQESEFTPEILVTICDSIKEDVRQFGRDLVTRNFQQSYGQDYLIKFSEHPSTDMQMFTTNYLESYAANKPEILQQLTPYFITVLSNVNRGGVAKKRIFAFLDSESQKSETAARIVADILDRQSATIAIGDKSQAIQTMLKIHKKYPEIPLPIQLKTV